MFTLHGRLSTLRHCCVVCRLLCTIGKQPHAKILSTNGHIVISLSCREDFQLTSVPVIVLVTIATDIEHATVAEGIYNNSMLIAACAVSVCGAQ